MVLINKDTLIGYTLPQNDFIIKGLRQWKYYKISDSLNKSENYNNLERIKLYVERIKNDSLDKVDFNKILKNDKEAFGLEEYKCKKLTESLKQSNKATKRQKVYKWGAVVGGAVLSGYLGYKYITK